MGLELVEYALDLPALVIQGGQFQGRRLLRIEQAGKQAVAWLGIGNTRQGILDHAHLYGALAAALVCIAGIDRAQVGTLRVFAGMLSGLSVNAEAMRRAAAEGFATATDLADYLVKKGLPFREAHEAVARAVRAAAEQGVDLAGLGLDALRRFSPLIAEDVHAALTLEGSLAARNHAGGTAPAQVLAAAARARSELAA
jgi:hypothetical protein